MKNESSTKEVQIKYVMKSKKVAIFVDWDNLFCDIIAIQKKQEKQHKRLKFNYNNMKQVANLLNKSFSIDDGEELYRIFFYTAKPKDDGLYKEWKENNSKRCDNIEKMLRNIKKMDYFAVRLGDMQKIIPHEQDKENNISFRQKGVDMLLGLDIAHVAYQHLVDIIIVFSRDRDIVPALKCARTNGLQVRLVDIIGHNKISTELIEHTDTIRRISLLKEFGVEE